jgi:cystathionine gamma-lyase/cystathionine beta-lyase/cystathionine gamma-lyase/homocysteine desulfhydrase
MTAKEKEKGFATRAIHVGQEPDPLTGAVSVPIYPTSTYVQEEIGKNKGYEYARVSNPTRDRLEENLASLEGGIGSKVFASGMAAINAIATMFKSGDHVICGHNLYGGTPRLFNQVLANFGMEFYLRRHHQT